MVLNRKNFTAVFTDEYTSRKLGEDVCLLSPCSGTGLLINLKKLTPAVHQGADWRLRYPTETEKIALKTP